MRFQFCGGNSAAEWFLAESSILSKIVNSIICSNDPTILDFSQTEIGRDKCVQASH